MVCRIPGLRTPVLTTTGGVEAAHEISVLIRGEFSFEAPGTRLCGAGELPKSLMDAVG